MDTSYPSNWAKVLQHHLAEELARTFYKRSTKYPIIFVPPAATQKYWRYLQKRGARK